MFSNDGVYLGIGQILQVVEKVYVNSDSRGRILAIERDNSFSAL